MALAKTAGLLPVLLLLASLSLAAAQSAPLSPAALAVSADGATPIPRL